MWNYNSLFISRSAGWETLVWNRNVCFRCLHTFVVCTISRGPFFFVFYSHGCVARKRKCNVLRELHKFIGHPRLKNKQAKKHCTRVARIHICIDNRYWRFVIQFDKPYARYISPQWGVAVRGKTRTSVYRSVQIIQRTLHIVVSPFETLTFQWQVMTNSTKPVVPLPKYSGGFIFLFSLSTISNANESFSIAGTLDTLHSSARRIFCRIKYFGSASSEFTVRDVPRLTIPRIPFDWIIVYSPFGVETTHHWCSNSICPRGHRSATTFWTFHRVFTRPSQKIVARVHRPVVSASAFCGRGVFTTLATSYFPPLPHAPRSLTSDDDCLVRKYDELSIAAVIGRFLMVPMFYRAV